MNTFNIEKTFKMKAERGWPEIYFCIDLHGTIIPSGADSNDKTDKMEFYPCAKEVLQWLTNRKDIKLILWTSTPQNRIGDVLKNLKENDIFFDYVNCNPHAKDTPRSDFSKKFYMNVIIDDRAGFHPEDGDWLLVAKTLEESSGDSIIKWDSDIKFRFEEIIRNRINKLKSFL